MRSLFITSLVLLTACSIPKSNELNVQKQQSNKIINGTVVASNSQEALATVAFYLPTGSDPAVQTIKNFCTGTLISPNVVVTAAHCIVNMADSLLTDPDSLMIDTIVGFGTKVVTDLNTPDFQYRKVKSFKVHPLYNLNSLKDALTKPMYDIALIKLSDTAPAPAQPIQVITNPNIVRKGLPLVVAGFGYTNMNPLTRATQLMEVNVLIENPSLSSVQFSYMNISGGSCNGDSGGPAFTRLSTGGLALVGVTSWGDGSCRTMGAFTSIPAMKDWIWTTIPSL